jgi:hypothetical protein
MPSGFPYREKPSRILLPGQVYSGFALASSNGVASPPFPEKPALLDPRAAALNQQDQYDYEQNTGYDPDNDCAVHRNSPFP